MIFVKHIFDIFSETVAQTWMKFGLYATKLGVQSLFKSILYDPFPPDYPNELLCNMHIDSVLLHYYVSSIFDYS